MKLSKSPDVDGEVCVELNSSDLLRIAMELPAAVESDEFKELVALELWFNANVASTGVSRGTKRYPDGTAAVLPTEVLDHAIAIAVPAVRKFVGLDKDEEQDSNV